MNPNQRNDSIASHASQKPGADADVEITTSPGIERLNNFIVEVRELTQAMRVQRLGPKVSRRDRLQTGPVTPHPSPHGPQLESWSDAKQPSDTNKPAAANNPSEARKPSNAKEPAAAKAGLQHLELDEEGMEMLKDALHSCVTYVKHWKHFDTLFAKSQTLILANILTLLGNEFGVEEMKNKKFVKRLDEILAYDYDALQAQEEKEFRVVISLEAAHVGSSHVKAAAALAKDWEAAIKESEGEAPISKREGQMVQVIGVLGEFLGMVLGVSSGEGGGREDMMRALGVDGEEEVGDEAEGQAKGKGKNKRKKGKGKGKERSVSEAK